MGVYRMAIMQFSFSNVGAVPEVIRRLPSETIEERITRKSYPGSGVKLIEPTERCSLVEFLGELKLAGYELVDASYRERIDAKDPRGKRTYHMVRFIFVRHEFVAETTNNVVRDKLRVALQDICESALWRVRAFSNPFYQNGEEVPGQRALSVNLEARVPLFRPDGQPVTAWQKDEDGRRIGDAPLPLRPDYYLRIMEGNVGLVANS